MKQIFSIFAVVLFLAGCQTTFTGDAHVTKAYCQKFCQTNGLNFSGMVALGEYSSGCVCSASRTGSIDNLAANGAGAGAVGVVMKMRAQQQAAHAAAAR